MVNGQCSTNTIHCLLNKQAVNAFSFFSFTALISYLPINTTNSYLMQEEVAKHGKKIYRTIKQPGHSVGEKIKDILIEIAIIVFAVTLSIWLHSWSEHRHEQKEVKEFLLGLKGDLNSDITLLTNNHNAIQRLDSSYRFLLSIKDNKSNPPPDSLIHHNLYFDMRVTRPAIGRYEGFKSSGKMELIENDSLKQSILVFYEQTIPNLVYGETFVNSSQGKILDLQLDNGDVGSIRNFIVSPKFMSLLSITTQNTGYNLYTYNQAILEAGKIVNEIEKELK